MLPGSSLLYQVPSARGAGCLGTVFLSSFFKFINTFEASQVSLVVKNLLANAGDIGSIPGSGRYPREGNGNSLQYPCLKNPMDRGAWWAIQFMGMQRVGHNWAIEHTHRTQLIYNGVLIYAVEQSDSVIIYAYYFFIFFSIMVYHRILNIVPCAIQ